MPRSKLVLTAGVLAVTFFAVGGLWAFIDPASFYDALATFPPFNKHFLRDAGSFQLGIAVTLLAALRWRSGVTVALVGASTASVVHAVSHLIDRNEGGRGSDHILLWAISLLLVAATVVQAREESNESFHSRP
jgi:hypothetical protein